MDRSKREEESFHKLQLRTKVVYDYWSFMLKGCFALTHLPLRHNCPTALLLHLTLWWCERTTKSNARTIRKETFSPSNEHRTQLWHQSMSESDVTVMPQRWPMRHYSENHAGRLVPAIWVQEHKATVSPAKALWESPSIPLIVWPDFEMPGLQYLPVFMIVCFALFGLRIQ